MSNFEFMQETVDAICYSMENEPNKWYITTHCVKKNSSNIEHWIDDLRTTWNGSSRDVVFSDDQAAQIRKSFNILKQKQATAAQQRVINTFKPAEKKVGVVKGPSEGFITKDKPWWRFWE